MIICIYFFYFRQKRMYIYLIVFILYVIVLMTFKILIDFKEFQKLSNLLHLWNIIKHPTIKLYSFLKVEWYYAYFIEIKRKAKLRIHGDWIQFYRCIKILYPVVKLISILIESTLILIAKMKYDLFHDHV